MPLRHNACVLDALEIRGRAIVVSVVDTEAPSAVLPQGAIPFSMVGLFVTAFEAIRERGALLLPFELVFGYGA